MVRQTGAVTDLQGLARRDHVCWAYDEVAEYSAAARQFLLDGLDRGERLLCVGEVAIRSATEGDAALPDASELVRTGRLDLLPLSDAYFSDGRPRSLRDQLRFYSKAVEQALADGYAGLRVAAELSDLTGEPEQWAAQVEWERAADRFIVSGPGMATLCAYRVDLVAKTLSTQLLEVHPLTGGAPALAEFRLFHDDDALVLTGEIDGFVADRLQALLDCTSAGGRRVTLDVAGVTFIDAAATSALAAWVEALADRGTEVRLRGAGRMLRRIWSVLGFREPVFS